MNNYKIYPVNTYKNPMDMMLQLKKEMDNVYAMMRVSIIRDISLSISKAIVENPEKTHFLCLAVKI